MYSFRSGFISLYCDLLFKCYQLLNYLCSTFVAMFILILLCYYTLTCFLCHIINKKDTSHFAAVVFCYFFVHSFQESFCHHFFQYLSFSFSLLLSILICCCFFSNGALLLYETKHYNMVTNILKICLNRPAQIAYRMGFAVTRKTSEAGTYCLLKRKKKQIGKFSVEQIEDFKW